MTRMSASQDIPLATDPNGNVSTGGRAVPGRWTANPLLAIPLGVFDQNGRPLTAVCTRIGINGTEAVLPSTAAAAAFDALGAYAAAHVRGDFVRGGQISIRVTVFQSRSRSPRWSLGRDKKNRARATACARRAWREPT